jgi:hypothetical protein
MRDDRSGPTHVPSGRFLPVTKPVAPLVLRAFFGHSIGRRNCSPINRGVKSFHFRKCLMFIRMADVTGWRIGVADATSGVLLAAQETCEMELHE